MKFKVRSCLRRPLDLDLSAPVMLSTFSFPPTHPSLIDLCSVGKFFVVLLLYDYCSPLLLYSYSRELEPTGRAVLERGQDAVERGQVLARPNILPFAIPWFHCTEGSGTVATGSGSDGE